MPWLEIALAGVEASEWEAPWIQGSGGGLVQLGTAVITRSFTRAIIELAVSGTGSTDSCVKVLVALRIEIGSTNVQGNLGILPASGPFSGAAGYFWVQGRAGSRLSFLHQVSRPRYLSYRQSDVCTPYVSRTVYRLTE